MEWDESCRYIDLARTKSGRKVQWNISSSASALLNWGGRDRSEIFAQRVALIVNKEVVPTKSREE